MQRDSYQQSGAEQLAVGLGWFSIGLGLAELTAPDAVARFIGLRDDSTTTSVLRAFGAREIGNGLAILMQPGNPTWLWSRVGGDALDLASLASAARHEVVDRERVGVAAAAVARRHRARRDLRPAAERRRTSSAPAARIALASGPRGARDDRQPSDRRRLPVLAELRELPALHAPPRVGAGPGNRRSRWRAKAPAGMRVEWEAETVRDDENEWIAWRSLEGSDVQNSGSVRFARGARRARHRGARAARVPRRRPARSAAASRGCSARSRSSRSARTCAASSS